MRAAGDTRSKLLRPELECGEVCSAGWDQPVSGLRDEIESGTGNPFRGGERA